MGHIWLENIIDLIILLITIYVCVYVYVVRHLKIIKQDHKLKVDQYTRLTYI